MYEDEFELTFQVPEEESAPEPLAAPAAKPAAVYLCCTFPQIALGGRYPLSLPCGARTFLTASLSALPRDRLSYSRSLL